MPRAAPKPYWQDELSRVYHGECRDIISRQLAIYDFIFADPPFNIGQDYNEFDDKVSPEEYEQFTMEWVAECWGSLGPEGILALHGPDHVCELYLQAMKGYREHRIAWINWHYRFGQCRRTNWIDSRCHCLIYARDPESYTWNPEDVLVQSDRAAVYGDKRVDETERGGSRLPFTVWGIPSDGPNWGRVQGNNKERRPGHPNQLPEAYLERLLRAYTNAGDRVGDPFGGSGTTGAVARRLERFNDTIEISEESCRSIVERFGLGDVRLK